jgi:hypothetical protein
MFTLNPKIVLFRTTKVVLLAATIVAALALSHGDEWHPALLVALLLMLALLGQWLSIEISGGQLSASLIAIVLGVGLLGPTPAATFGIAAMILTSSLRRLTPVQWLNNLTLFALVPFAGGLMARAAVSQIHDLHNQDLKQSATFGLILFGVFIVMVALHFMLFALDLSVEGGRTFTQEMRGLLALLPGELATGTLATILAVAYTSVGFPALFAAIVVLVIFRQLTVALLRSEDRAEQLYARSRQLVGLQLGVLRTLVRALGTRDKTSARHAAAVALYAKALAAELGCSEDEQDSIHAAGLLHEIGKFTWPDRILHADVIAAEDMPIVESHPQEGAILVGALDGYGQVADVILYHHERVDGRGYPAGLIGNEIPLGSRILAICSIYDTVTARQSYRAQMTSEEAMAELRNGARSGQLDAELVETFISVLDREGADFAADTDYEAELDFERRVREMAEPRTPDNQRVSDGSSLSRRDWRSGMAELAHRALNRH